jgi:hypothetical protein
LGEERSSCRALCSESIGERRQTEDPEGPMKVYRIVVRGELSARYATAFEGMEMEAASGRTILTGEIIDQPHLHGILDRINGLGLDLVRVEAVPEGPN